MTRPPGRRQPSPGLTAGSPHLDDLDRPTEPPGSAVRGRASVAARLPLNRSRPRRMPMVKVALVVRMVAKPGKEEEVRAFLAGAEPLARGESFTPAWFALR